MLLAARKFRLAKLKLNATQITISIAYNVKQVRKIDNNIVHVQRSKIQS